MLDNLVRNSVYWVRRASLTATVGYPKQIEIELTKIGVTVSDTGPGVDPRYEESLFEIFVTGKPDRDPGQGLGLFIVRELLHIDGCDVVLLNDRNADGRRYKSAVNLLPLAKYRVPMQVSEALRYLGSKRVIWIDDCFNDTPAQLARVLVNSLEAARACSFPELSAALESYQYDASGAEASTVQILTDVKPERLAAIKAAFFDSEGDQKQFATRELSAVAIERTCELLGVTVDDRWTFDKAERLLAAVIADGDADVSYIVDLNEAGGSKTRGLDILRALWDRQSTGTAFILTRETDAAGEGQRESELRQTLSDPAQIPLEFPFA